MRLIALGNAAIHFIPISKAAHAGPSSSTSSCTFAVPRQSISTGKLAVALLADVRLLASVKLAVPLQVVKSTEAHLALKAYKWLLLAVRQQVAFQIVVTSEFSVTVGTLVLLGRGRSWRALAL
jgi:hypothetical protein